jgi:DNA-binding transcriptional MerR regulator
MMATVPLQTRADANALIPDRLYFKIGDVAVILGVAPSVLRFWESQFPQLKPGKSGTGQRLYRRKDVELALEIKRLVHDEGFTLAGARQALSAKPLAKTSATPHSRTGAGMRLHRRLVGNVEQDALNQPTLPMVVDDAARLRDAAVIVSHTRNELRLMLNQLSQPVKMSVARTPVLEFIKPVQMGLF